jgi:hypothetical protein
MTEPKRKTVCVKGSEVDLYEKGKAQAKADRAPKGALTGKIDGDRV